MRHKFAGQNWIKRDQCRSVSLPHSLTYEIFLVYRHGLRWPSHRIKRLEASLPGFGSGKFERK
jgi:hypothetical protein